MMSKYGRKFIAFAASMVIFTVLMIIAIYKELTQDLGMFAVLLATAIMQISGAYYAGNVMAIKKRTDNGTGA